MRKMNPKAVRKHAVYFSDYRTNSNMLPGHVMLQLMKSAFWSSSTFWQRASKALEIS